MEHREALATVVAGLTPTQLRDELHAMSALIDPDYTDPADTYDAAPEQLRAAHRADYEARQRAYVVLQAIGDRIARQ
jgi:hypothetical protein